MSKKPGLPAMDASAFARAAVPVPDPVQAVTKRKEPEQPVVREEPKSKSRAVASAAPPSRAGKVQLGVWVTEQMRKDLKREALDSGRAVDVIVNELITDFLRKKRQ